MATMRPMKAPTVVPTPEEIQYPCWASYKIDGLRGIVTKTGLMSNSMKPLPNGHCQKEFATDSYFGFDGELVEGQPNTPGVYKRTLSAVMTIGGEPDVYYYVFDICTEETKDMPFEKRYQMLKVWFDTLKMCGHDRVHLVPQKLCHTPEELDAFEKEAIQLGFEGVMIRKGDSPYKYGRSTMKQAYILKLKRFVDAEAYVVGFEEEMTNLNEATTDAQGLTQRGHSQENKVAAGRLGALVVKDPYTGNIFKIGTGFSHALKQEIWDNKHDWRGTVVTYKHFPIGDYDVPRIPVFKGKRDPRDWSPELAKEFIYWKHDGDDTVGFCFEDSEFEEMSKGAILDPISYDTFCQCLNEEDELNASES